MSKENRRIKDFLKKILLVSLLFLIPILLMVTSITTIRVQEKSWYGSGYDPSYAYLYNSLNMARFRMVGHIDHPGTTMQVIGGVILQTAWIIDPYGGKNLTEAVLSEPEHYLRILNTGVAVLGALSLLIAGIFVATSCRNIWYALLLQTIPFLSGLILYNGFLRISQESVLMIASVVMAAYILFWYFKNSSFHEKSFVTGFGIITGFGIASKVIFIPLMLIPLIIFSTNKNRIRYLIVSALGFVFFTIPIIPMYPNMAWWFINLFIHSGIYGQGATSIIDQSNYLSDLKGIVIGEPLYLAIYIMTLIALATLVFARFFWKKSYDKPATLIFIGVILTETFGFLIVAKHPKLAYLLPYECISIVGVILVIHLFTRYIKNHWIRNLLTGIIVIPFILFTVKYGIKSKEELYSVSKNWKYEEAWRTASQVGVGWAVIGVNPGPSPIAANYFANVYSKNRYSKMLYKIYPDQYIFDSYKNLLLNWNYDTLSFDEIMNKYQGKIAIIGDSYQMGMTKDLLTKGNSKIQFEKMWSGGAEIIVPRETSNLADYSPRKLLYSGAEKSDINQQLITYNLTQFDSFGEYSSLESFDGRGSIITNNKSPYAFSLKEKDVVPGTTFHISVFAKGNPLKANIVGAANNTINFYAIATQKSEEIRNGWFKINIDIIITKFIPDNQLNIYCWNSGDDVVYFDDFSMERSVIKSN